MQFFGNVCSLQQRNVLLKSVPSPWKDDTFQLLTYAIHDAPKIPDIF